MLAMKTDRAKNEPSYILAGDIGGTNTSLALMKNNGGSFEMKSRQVYSTPKLDNLSQAIQLAAEAFQADVPGFKIEAACLSIAGPVVDNRCVPTNISWSLDGDEISREFGFPTLVINDFTAVCYGIPLLDVNDPQEITPLPHPDGSMPEQSEYLPGIGVQAVAGAGTGLGVGYLVEEQERILALPAEGGHMDFAPFNEITRELQLFMFERNGAYPEPEMFVSGIGIANIFHFMREKKGADSKIIRDIDVLPDSEKPPAISANIDNDPVCREILELFVSMYARVAHNLSLAFIPKKGLFLAGGIAAKNKQLFLENNRFMNLFLHNFQPSIRPVLASIPVYIVEDYKISLYGAANAYIQLSKFLSH